MRLSLSLSLSLCLPKFQLQRGSVVLQIPVLSQWGGDFCVKLNLTSPAAVGWFLDRVGALQDLVAMEYVLLEGAEAGPPGGPGPLWPLGGEQYIGLLADVAARMGESAIMTAGTR